MLIWNYLRTLPGTSTGCQLELFLFEKSGNQQGLGLLRIGTPFRTVGGKAASFISLLLE